MIEKIHNHNMTHNWEGTVFVTGGAGFIGSHLIDRLISENVNVKIFDNLSTGLFENISTHNNNELFEFIEGDLKDKQNIKEALQNVDVVFHLAANPEVKGGFENPEISYEQNTRNTFYLLEEIRKSTSDIKKIIFASSSVVYGEPNIFPTPEKYGPLKPISHYGSSKLACEALICSYGHNYGIDTKILRLANIIGSRSRHGVIWDFINKLRKDVKRLEILGDGKQTKSYMHISDCVEAFISISNTSNNQIVNVGNDDKIDVMSIAKIVCKNMNLETTDIVSFGGTGDGRGWIGDVKEMQLDITKLKKLGLGPNFSSEESVELASKELLKT